MPPKFIWCLWYQGWENAPDLVKACTRSWKNFNPGWEFRCLTKETVDYYLADSKEYQSASSEKLPTEALSDIIRIELLHKFGGIWVDATVYCLRSLDEWIDHATQTGFFAFDKPGPDRMLSSWFLAANHGAHIIDVWRKETLLYWHGRSERDHYFWFHYLFADAYRSDRTFRKCWDETPKISASGPHLFSPYAKLLKPITYSDQLIVETAQIPVLKLTHKIAHENGIEGTAYRWLCDRATTDGG